MTNYPYPKGLIPLTAGFMKNSKDDNTVMGISNDLHGGMKVVDTIADMLSIHPSYLSKDWSVCMVLDSDGAGASNIYVLSETPASADSTVITEWKKWSPWDAASVGFPFRFKNKINPSSYVLTDSSPTNVGGDIYLVETDVPVTITDPNLMGGVPATCYNGDWIVFDQDDSMFVYFGQSSGVRLSWDALTGKPTIITDLVDGILPSHTHDVSKVTLSKVVGGTTHESLQTLLEVALYVDIVSTRASTATDNQLLPLSQLKELFLEQTTVNTAVSDALATALNSYYTKEQITILLEGKQDTLTSESAKELLEHDGSYKILTSYQVDGLLPLVGANSSSFANTLAKIHLVKAMSASDDPLNLTKVVAPTGEETISAIGYTVPNIYLEFEFTTLGTYAGNFLINGAEFDTILRIGDSDRFSASSSIDLTGVSSIEITGDASLSIPVSELESWALSVGYTPATPETKVAFINGDTIELQVEVSDSAVNFIEITDYDSAIESGLHAVTPVWDGTKWMTTVPYSFNTAQVTALLSVKIVPYKGTLTGKSYIQQSLIPVDNSSPDITLNAVYSNGFSALSAGDTVTITAEGSDYDTITFSSEAGLIIDSVAGTSLVASRDFGTDSFVKVTATAVKQSNNTTSVFEINVRIYTIQPTFNVDIVRVRSGLGNVPIILSNSNGIALVRGAVQGEGAPGIFSWESGSLVGYISASPSDLHSYTEHPITFSITTISGMLFDLVVGYAIYGFAPVSFNIDYPTFELVLPMHIMDTGSVDASLSINSAYPFDIDPLVKDLEAANGFSIVGDTIILNSDLVDFGYNFSNNITLQIEEK